MTITNELGQSRTLHPDGKEESIVLQGVPFAVTTKRDGDHLVVDYRVEQDREVRTPIHTTTNAADSGSSSSAAPATKRRVYEPGVETAAATPPTPPGRIRTTRDRGCRLIAQTGSAGAFDARPGPSWQA